MNSEPISFAEIIRTVNFIFLHRAHSPRIFLMILSEWPNYNIYRVFYFFPFRKQVSVLLYLGFIHNIFLFL